MAERPNSGKLWRADDDAELRRRIAARQPPAVLARELGRTQDAIRGRAAELGLMLPSAIRPWKINFPRGPRGGLRAEPGASLIERPEDE